MGIFDTSPKTGVLRGVASSYSDNPSKDISVTYADGPNRIILYKTEHIAVLQKLDEIKFITVFDDITKEGYRLMAISEGRFYFQRY